MKRFFTRDSWRLPAIFANVKLRLLAVLLWVMAMAFVVLGFHLSWLVGLVALLFVIMVIVITINVVYQTNQNTSEYLTDLSYRIKKGEQESFLRLPIGILFYNEKAEIAWVNPAMQRYFGKEKILGHPLKEVDETLADLIVIHQDDDNFCEISWKDKYYTFRVQKEIRAVYLFEVTEYIGYKHQYEDSRVVLGQIFLDNYDEVTKSLNDQEISRLSSYVTTTLSDWAERFKMYLKRIDEDHYFVLGYTSMLEKMEEEKFKILDEIREYTSKRNNPITLSVGIAYGGDNLANLASQAQSNLDLALGRGGDQVVVRAKDGQARFYGGKTNPLEKRTRVRARMISQALQDLMRQSEQVFVMGHKNCDMDSIGACLGVRRIAAMNQKKCWIVLDKENLHSDILRLLESLEDYPEIAQSIISPAEALERAINSDLLVMVDHSKPSMSVSLELYEAMANRTMIIDHHRRGEEFPQNPMLVYIEPYASSTCELITEMFEYQQKDLEPINKIEATAMLTGIIIDTKSFALRSGTRTFDAASYLRSVGADPEMSRHFTKENAKDYIQRNHLLERLELLDDNALSTGEEERIYDPVTAAQAADSLLNISGVEASFVITRRNEDTVGISARSNGKKNVQVIMEQLGGGGHLSNAATQIKDTTVAQARQDLLALLQADAEENK
ncbi:DHH family phosphoesterase [Ligilactobacillus equi]